MNYSSYIALIPLLPLAGFVLLGLFGRKYFKNFSGILGCAILLISTGLALYAAYNSFLSLFTFSMLGLVMASNIFQIYIFWELVGVSSYLLIGFYYSSPSAVAASKKAFIVTRFADLGFLIGILILAFHAETLDFHTLIERLTTTQSSQFISIATSSFLGVSML